MDQLKVPGPSRLAISVVLGLLMISFGLVIPGAASSPGTPTVGTLIKVSPDASPFTPTCHGNSVGGTLYYNAKDEPFVSANPANTTNIIGVYQQDRWSDGGSDGIVAAYTMNGGSVWKTDWPTLTHCSGGNHGNNGDFERASDPWVSFSPNGVAYMSALAFNYSFNSQSSVAVVKTTDGGKTWGTPTQVISEPFLSDKDSVTADPTNSNYAYVVWDLFGTGAQVYFSSTSNGGSSWSAGRQIFGLPTIANVVVVMPSGRILDTFTDDSTGNLVYISSFDHGTTWSTSESVITQQEGIGVTDPRNGVGIRSGTGIASLTVNEKTGAIYAVWEDARFSGFTTEAIAFTMSTNGGKTWSAPVQINKSPAGVQAFTPVVQVRSDGTVAVTYYDFRQYHTGLTKTPTDLWVVECSTSCTNSANWAESHVAGSFNIENAPNAGGYFLGDYQGIANTGTGFQPFWVMTVMSTSIRTDVFTASVT